MRWKRLKCCPSWNTPTSSNSKTVSSTIAAESFSFRWSMRTRVILRSWFFIKRAKRRSFQNRGFGKSSYRSWLGCMNSIGIGSCIEIWSLQMFFLHRSGSNLGILTLRRRWWMVCSTLRLAHLTLRPQKYGRTGRMMRKVIFGVLAWFCFSWVALSSLSRLRTWLYSQNRCFQARFQRCRLATRMNSKSWLNVFWALIPSKGHLLQNWSNFLRKGKQRVRT